jgi:hypothetical protein
MAQAIEAALEIYAYTCLYKPFKIEELLELLAEIQHQELAHVLGRYACNCISPSRFPTFSKDCDGAT